MSDRSASVIVCDDFTWSLTGKANLIGVYVQDILIPSVELPINQMVFFFTVQTGADDPFQHLALKVNFPGDEPIIQPIPISVPESPRPVERTKLFFRLPILVQQRILRPGKIATSVIHERGELDAGGVWIIHPQSS